MIADELEKLNRLHEEGKLSDEDYGQAKEKILGKKAADRPPLGMEDNTFCLLLHLSQFAGFLVPGAGMVLPLILWLAGKDKSVEVDFHGRVIINWIISFLIYAVAAVLLCFVLIGFLILPIILLLGIVFPIVGAIKAADGQRWRYPLTIPFLSLPEE